MYAIVYACVCLCVVDSQASKMLADRIQELCDEQFDGLISKVKDVPVSENHKKVKRFWRWEDKHECRL